MPAAPSKPTPNAPAKPSRLPLIIIAVLLLALGGAGAGWYLSIRQHSGDEAELAQAPQPILPLPALYHALEPAFIVNLESPGFDGPRYLQVEVQLMTRDARVHAALEQHTPALRSRLLLLFDQQQFADISTREGKEALQQKALAEVRDLIQSETGSDAVEALLFTSFVTQ